MITDQYKGGHFVQHNIQFAKLCRFPPAAVASGFQQQSLTAAVLGCAKHSVQFYDPQAHCDHESEVCCAARDGL